MVAEDYAAAVKDSTGRWPGRSRSRLPNFDLLIEACRTTSVALFPNFMFLDAPFNRHEKWRIDDPDRFRYEVATMGCRTRVFEDPARREDLVGPRQPLVHLDEPAAAGHRGDARGLET